MTMTIDGDGAIDGARATSPVERRIARCVEMLCAISGTTPTNAVVTPGGVVYDKALIVKAIEVRR